MFNVEKYIKKLIEVLEIKFEERLLYVGLQGSYLRREATEDSDIDIMVVIDDLSYDDLKTYKKIVSELDSPEKACGFICGKNELKKWNPLEMFSLVNGTKNYYGDLRDLIPVYGDKEVVYYIKLSAANVYHELAHRFIYDDLATNKAKLSNTYKNVFFILQCMYYLKTGDYFSTKKELMMHLSEEDKLVMQAEADIKGKKDYNFNYAFNLLFEWSKAILNTL